MPRCFVRSEIQQAKRTVKKPHIFGGTWQYQRVTRSPCRRTYSEQLRDHPAVPQAFDNGGQKQTEAVDWSDDEEEDQRQHLDIDIAKSNLDPMPVKLLGIDITLRRALAVLCHSFNCRFALVWGEELGV